MNRKIILLLLLISSLMGYLAWGTDQKAFLFQLEAELLRKMFSSPKEVVHPFVILPFIGQIILLSSLLAKKTPKWFVVTGILCLGILLLMVLLTGILSGNMKVILCALPYCFFSILFFLRKEKKEKA